jgi:hypothetical protein
MSGRINTTSGSAEALELDVPDVFEFVTELFPDVEVEVLRDDECDEVRVPVVVVVLLLDEPVSAVEKVVVVLEFEVAVVEFNEPVVEVVIILILVVVAVVVVDVVPLFVLVT